MSILGIVSDPRYRDCKNADDTMKHILCNFLYFDLIRLSILGVAGLQWPILRRESLKSYCDNLLQYHGLRLETPILGGSTKGPNRDLSEFKLGSLPLHPQYLSIYPVVRF